MENRVVRVGIADLKTAKTPELLVTLGLGSCVGITFYDPKSGIGGLAHIMLPDSKQARAGAINTAKFADTAIPLIVEQLDKMGASKSRLVVKIAGGAQMFSFMGADDRMRIGERNTEAVKLALKNQGLKISGEDTGGSHGRSMELNLQTGRVSIKTIEQGIKEL